MRLCLFLSLLLCGSSLGLQAQALVDVFQVDRNTEKRICALPDIYFVASTAEIDAVNKEDIKYLAQMLKKHKRLKIKLQPEVVPHPQDASRKILADERLSHIEEILHHKYEVHRDRILRDPYRELSRGYVGGQTENSISLSKITCNCIWTRKIKKKKKKVRLKEIPAPLPKATAKGGEALK